MGIKWHVIDDVTWPWKVKPVTPMANYTYTIYRKQLETAVKHCSMVS